MTRAPRRFLHAQAGGLLRTRTHRMRAPPQLRTRAPPLHAMQLSLAVPRALYSVYALGFMPVP
jgi:hypothetical protein